MFQHLIDTSFSFLQNGGNMGHQIRRYNWLTTGLGHPDQWPQSLRTALGLVLHSGTPMLLFWGKEQTCFFNDAYQELETTSGSFTRLLGQPAAVWQTTWPEMGLSVSQVLAGGTTGKQHQPEAKARSFYCSAVPGEDGRPAGVLVTATETGRTTAALRKMQLSQQRFENLIRQATIGVVILKGADMLVEMVNEAYAVLIDRTPEVLLGKPLFDVIPETRSSFIHLLEKVRLQGESVYLYDHPYFVYVNGQRKEGFLHVVYQPYREADGTISGVMATCHDVTEQVLARQKIETDERRFRNLIENAPVATCLFTGRNMLIEVANGPMMDFWGKGSTVLGRPLAEAVPELIGQSFLDQLDHVFTSGQEYSGRAIPALLERNGTRSCFYFDFTYRPLFNEKGEVYGIMNMAVDVTEQVVSRRQLEESEAYFRQLTDSVPAIIWTTRADGYCTYLNKNWYSYTGQTREEAEGTGWLTITHPDDHDRVEQTFIRAMENHHEFRSIYRLRHTSGLYRWVIDTGTPRFEADGTYMGMMGTVVDIHEQKTAEEGIKRSEARFRSLIAAAPVAIGLFVGRDLIIELPNRMFIDIVGKGDGIIGKPLREAMPELLTENQPFLQILDDVYTSGKMFQTFGTQVKIVQQGVLTHNYYDFTYTPLLDDEGSVFAILDIAVDVTEQVLARKKVEEAEARTRMAVEAAEMGMYEINLQERSIIATPRFTEIFGIANNSHHTAYIEAIHPDDQALRKEAHAHAYQTGNMSYESRVVHQDGTVHWIKVKGKVEYNAEKQPVKLLGVVQDITEQKELERQKDSFLGIASHELKTPVTSMKAYAQLMEKVFRRNGDTRNAELVAKMNYQANRLSSLITDLLDVTKINNGRLLFNFALFNFNELVAETLDEIQHTSPNHHFRRQLAPTVSVYGDRERIGQVIINLVTNAVKYSPDTRDIIVRTEHRPGEIQLSVQDFGIGISPEKTDRVFEQFYRVSGHREHTFPGLGLGLYISSEIIKRMNGRIWVHSVEGQGSTFSFSIPVHPEPQPMA